ncbi:MAG: FmdB family zinc ribbon protein [Bacillota bacterium]|jgi:putative FmdB family regulatory protein
MPKHTFRCKKCQTEFTVNTSWEEKDQVPCPQCGSVDKDKIFKSVGVISSSSGCPTWKETGTCPSGSFS